MMSRLAAMNQGRLTSEPTIMSSTIASSAAIRNAATDEEARAWVDDLTEGRQSSHRRPPESTGGQATVSPSLDFCAMARACGYPRALTAADPVTLVNALEAARVREIFRLYLSHGGLTPVVEELNRRGWRNKAWKT